MLREAWHRQGVNRWAGTIGSFDGQRVVTCEFHVSQSDACSERHVHAQTDDACGERTFETSVGNDQRFALQPDDAPVDHVKGNETFNRLL